MILILEIFNKVVEKLKVLKNDGEIVKFFIQLTQTNTIKVVVVSENEITNVNLYNLDVKLTVLKPFEIEEDEYYSNLFDSNDELIYYKNSRRKLTNLLNVGNEYLSKTPIIGYYS